MKAEILEQLDKLTIEKWWDFGNYEEIRDKDYVASNLEDLFNEQLQQKQSEIDELVDELTQIKLYGINDETLDKLIQKHK